MSEQLQERQSAFIYTEPSLIVQRKLTHIRAAYQSLTAILDDAMPECHEKTLAFTALETSAMWFMKALSRTDPEGK